MRTCELFDVPRTIGVDLIGVAGPTDVREAETLFSATVFGCLKEEDVADEGGSSSFVDMSEGAGRFFVIWAGDGVFSRLTDRSACFSGAFNGVCWSASKRSTLLTFFFLYFKTTTRERFEDDDCAGVSFASL